MTLYTLPSNITEIKDETFYNCTFLKTITIPNNVKSIGKNAFFCCSALENIIIPKGCTTIGESAFNNCRALKNIVFPNTIEDIGMTTFNDCPKLEEIIITTPVPPAGSIGQNGVSVKRILVPNKSQYMEHDYWAGYNIVEMVTYDKDGFEYNGKEPKVNFINNLEYEMRIEPYHLQKEAGTYTENITINYYKDSELYFSFEYPYTYTIKKAPLQIEIGNSMKEYGQENPKFTYTITGFVNGETVSSLEEMPEIMSTATQYSEVGMYPITATIKTSNYEPQITNGVLAITKKPLLIIANDQIRKYKEANPAFDVTVKGFVGKDDKEVLTKAPTIECNATTESEAGEYFIIPSGAEAKNYSFSYINGTLTIEPASQEITWEQDFSNISAGNKIQLSAESSSKLPIIYTSSNESIASISQIGGKYYLNCLKPGNVIIYAIQNGNNNYESATTISKEISIQTDPTGIDYIYTQGEVENVKIFDIGGRKLAHPHKGLNIIKTPDGTIKKIMKK